MHNYLLDTLTKLVL